ncbi:MAG: hypothetical protein M3M95_07100 [Pseudomonadota bacterium]|nr:hypothetical protein [Pseudomonadota bacterium]
MLTTLVSVALLSLAAQDSGSGEANAAPQTAEAPVSTAPAAIRQQPAPPPAEPPAPVTGDYNYVAECFGSLSGFIDARAKALPEVERIERTWAGKLGSTTAEQAMADYAQMGVQAEKDQALLRRALAAAEGASPRNVVAAGQSATASARAKWGIKDAKVLAREWMSWTLPQRCLQEAAVLEQKSTLNTALLRGGQTAAQPSTAPQN